MISKRLLGRSRRRWEENIKMDLKEKGDYTSKWVNLPQEKDYCRIVVNKEFNLRVAGAMKLVLKGSVQ